MKYSLEDIYDRSRVNKLILTEIINLFIIKEKHARFLEFIDSPKRYDNFLHELLNDPRNIKPECIIEVPSNEQFVESFAEKLRQLGAGKKAYLVSSNDELDGKIGTLEEMLSAAASEGLVYCIGTRLD